MKALKPASVGAGRYLNANGGGAFSPDGQFLAYYAFRAPNTAVPGTTLLVIRTLSTGAEREIPMPELRVPPAAMAPPVRWFPDGRSVLVAAFQSTSPGAAFYRIDISTGRSELLCSTRLSAPGQAFPDLALDGKAIVYLDRGPERAMQLIRMNLETREQSELRRTSKGQEITSIAVSPDGTQVAYGSYDVSTKQTALMTMPAAGGEPREVSRASNWQNGGRFSLGWSRDAKYLIFARPDGGGPTPSSPQNLWRVPLSGGEPEKMGISAESIFYPQISPDGRRVAFTGRENNAQEIWALESFLPKRVAAR
jgi:Tol biopolymer transport system component